MLEILAQVVETPILEVIRSSRAISLEVDETTDVLCRSWIYMLGGVFLKGFCAFKDIGLVDTY